MYTVYIDSKGFVLATRIKGRFQFPFCVGTTDRVSGCLERDEGVETRFQIPTRTSRSNKASEHIVSVLSEQETFRKHKASTFTKGL